MGAFENADCQPDGIHDEEQLVDNDADQDGIPDDCQDCNTNGQLDSLDIALGSSEDCNSNGVPDECDVGSECSLDADGNGVPDECQMIWQLRDPFDDPRTGNSGVEGAAASLIAGKIYVSHGNRQGADTDFLSIYDLSTDTWTHGPPSAPDASVVRSELAGGTAFDKHYAVGGRKGTGQDAGVRDQLEEFEPGVGWTPKAPLAGGPRAGLGGASWNGKIYAIGGRDDLTFGTGMILNTNEVYDPNTDSWGSLASLSTPVSDNYATIAINGKIYVFGGAISDIAVTREVQIYDIASDSWSSGAPMPTHRAAAMAGVTDGLIAVFGGYDPDPCVGRNLDITELYDPATDRWFPGPRMFEPASEMAQGVTWDGNGAFAVGSGIFGTSGSVVQRLVPRSACLADIDKDCDVDVTDLLALLASSGPCPPPPASCLADFNGDGVVDTIDLLFLLASFGPCPSCPAGSPSQSLQAGIENAGLVWPEDWNTFLECVTTGTEVERATCVCWLIHYLEGCQGLLCIPPVCPGADPFLNPPLMHSF